VKEGAAPWVGDGGGGAPRAVGDQQLGGDSREGGSTQGR